MSHAAERDSLMAALTGAGLNVLEVGHVHAYGVRLAVDASAVLRGVTDPVVIVCLSDDMAYSLRKPEESVQSVARVLLSEFGLGDNTLAFVLTPDDISLPPSQAHIWRSYSLAGFTRGLKGPEGRQHLRQLLLKTFPLIRLNPYQSKRAVRESMFFGRREELANLRAVSENYVVVGPRRGGKTSLALEVERQLRSDPQVRLSLGARGGAERYLCSVSYVDTQALIDFDSLWEAILRKMGLEPRDTVGGIRKKTRLRADRTVVVDKSDFELLSDLLEHKYRKALILLDEVDRLVEMDASQHWSLLGRLRTLVDSPQARTRVVLLGYDRLFKAAKSPQFPLHGRFEFMRVANLEHEWVRELIRLPMEELGIVIDDLSQIAARVDRATGGQPHLIQDVCHALVRLVHGKREPRLTVRDVEQLIERDGPRLIERVFLAFNELPDPLARLVAYISARQESQVTRVVTLLDVLRSTYRLRIDDVPVRDALDYLDLYNVLQCSDRYGDYWFASQLLKSRLRAELKEPHGAAALEALVESARQKHERSQ